MSEPDLVQERSLAMNLDRRQSRSERSNSGSFPSKSPELKAIVSGQPPEDPTAIVTPPQPSLSKQPTTNNHNLPLPSKPPNDEVEIRRRLRHLVQRVHHLEKALDQALAVNQELKQQIQDQRFLEQHLATTEEFSHLQKREIDRLRYQLTQSQPQLIQDLETKVKTSWERVVSLEVQLEEARQQITRLCQNLSDRQADLAKAEAQLAQMQVALAEEKALVQAMQQDQTTIPANQTVAKLLKELVNAKNHIEYLEIELSNQSQHHELMQQAYQELELEHLNIRNGATVPDFPRIKELEFQVGQMQEQILAQATQVSEYEATIQHWKDRCLQKQSRAAQLKEAIQKALPNPPDALVDLLNQLIAVESESTIVLGRSAEGASDLDGRRHIDLPAFLTRRQKRFDRRS